MKKITKIFLNENSKMYDLLSYIYNIKKNYWQPARYDNLNELLTVYLGINPNAKFIQVGSNDGLSNDPLNKFIDTSNWSGICIEPVPDNFRLLQETYKLNTKVQLFNCAIGNDGLETIYFINPHKAKKLNIDLPSWYRQLASFDKNLVVSNDINATNKLEIVDEIEIKSVSFNTLIKENNIVQTDLVHIDAEGADWRILSSLPFNLISPDIILFEHNHLTLNDYKAANLFLRKNGYRLLKINTDTFCYKKKLKVLFKDIEKKASYIFMRNRIT